MNLHRFTDHPKLRKKSNDSCCGVLAFDLDRTLLTQNSSLAFCRYLLGQKLISYTNLLFCFRCYFSYRYLGGSYHQLHQKVFARLLRNKNYSVFEEHAQKFVQAKIRSLYNKPVVERLKQGKKRGVKTLILSSSPIFLVEPIAHLLEADAWLATTYKVDAEGYIDQIDSFIDGEKKAQYLRHFTTEIDGPVEAYSDSFDDLPFLLAATKSIAVKPDTLLRRYAKKSHWEIL